MDPTQPLRVLINLGSFVDTLEISSTDGQEVGGDTPHKKVFLWTAFFKIDGDTTFVNEGLNLQGTATVVGTPGNHGNLGSTDRFTGSGVATISILPQLGQFRTILQPIPLRAPIGNIKNVPGAVGCVALLIAEGGLPDEAVAKGHDAFNSSMQTQLDQIIATLGVGKPAPFPDDITSMTQAISDAVESTVKKNLSFWQKLAAFFLGQNEIVGHALFQFSGSDLAKAPATGLPLQDLFSIGGTGQGTDSSGNPVGGEVSISEFYQLNGLISCDPFDLSLKRFLQSQRLIFTQGIRSFMQPRFSSVRNWMASALG
jgi:hypothetical protein